ncbi:MAG: hypothetical protein JW832_09735 [Deltaproteobacteria bacterium]|nr:hypothetical protein [Deltaproteobacteria bacterium]
MPITASYERSGDLTVFTAAGELTYEEQLAALQEFYDGNPTANVLWDFRSIKGNRITTEELNKIIVFIKRRESKRPHGKTALVARTDLDFGLSRVSQAYADIHELPWQIRAFRSMDEALMWIEEG